MASTKTRDIYLDVPGYGANMIVTVHTTRQYRVRLAVCMLLLRLVHLIGGFRSFEVTHEGADDGG